MSLRLVYLVVAMMSICFPLKAADKPDLSKAEKSNTHTILLDRLVAAYPEFLQSHSGNFLIWKDGTRMKFDDGIKKDFDQRLNSADLQDMFYTKYSLALSKLSPAHNSDPGRVRFEPFFKKMYGSDKRKVRKNLTSINWLPRKWGKKVKVTVINGVAKRLQKISYELDALPIRFNKYLIPARKSDRKFVPGIFNWRVIKGTKRLSVHSFGAALDLQYLQYWRTKTWKNRPHNHKRRHKHNFRNTMPREIVEIFERHGFIWGGKWYHYDTMHFEYRPELLPASR